MNRFSATTESEAVVDAPRADIWAALTDPVLLPKLTPLLERIDVDDATPDIWTWHMLQIKALGVGISPCFTERMVFDEAERVSRIDYAHQPPAGARERTGAEGWYVLEDVTVDGRQATTLTIKLTLTVELPLPRSAGPAVRRVMTSTINRTGDKFARNLLAHLGARELQPSAR